MKKFLYFCFLFFAVVFIVSAQSEEQNNEQLKKIKTLFLPALSYEYTAFDDVQFHDISARLNIMRLNPEDRSNSLFISIKYNPVILNDKPEYQDLFHDASLSFVKTTGKHIFNTTLSVDSHSYMGVGFYGYNIINKDHFSMNIGAGLLVMDIDADINGIPWIFWPVPFVGFSWKYEWFRLNLMLPSSRFILAPNHPISLVLEGGFGERSALLRYRYFKDENPQNEILMIGIGIKNATNRINLSDLKRYHTEYNAVYGTVKVFRLVELSAGWTFDGKERENRFDWDYIKDSLKNWGRTGSGIGDGFFISISAGISF